MCHLNVLSKVITPLGVLKIGAQLAANTVPSLRHFVGFSAARKRAAYSMSPWLPTSLTLTWVPAPLPSFHSPPLFQPLSTHIPYLSTHFPRRSLGIEGVNRLAVMGGEYCMGWEPLPCAWALNWGSSLAISVPTPNGELTGRQCSHTYWGSSLVVSFLTHTLRKLTGH